MAIQFFAAFACYASEIGMCEPQIYFNAEEARWEVPSWDHCMCMGWGGEIEHVPHADLFPGQRVVREGYCRDCQNQRSPFIGFLNGHKCDLCRPDLYPPDW